MASFPAACKQVGFEALDAVVELTEDTLPPDAIALRFYDLSYQQGKIIIVRIRLRDPDTDRGFDRW